MKGNVIFIILMIFFGFFSAALSADAATYYVAVNGSDSGAGTQAAPFRTINKALSAVGAVGTEAGSGKIVQVAAGTYAESLIDKIPSGSSWAAPFILKCAIPRTCIITPGNTYAIGFNISAYYIEIRGFVIDGQNNPSASAMYFSSATADTFHHIRIVDNEMKNFGGMGIQAGGSSDLEILQNSIHDLGSGCLGYCHAIYVADHTSGWLIEKNVIYNSKAYGIHIYGDYPQYITNHVVRYNVFHDNGTAGVTGSGMIAYGSGHQIYGNIAYHNVNEGILLRSVSNILVYNNTTYNNGSYGVSKESGSGVMCKNNIAVNNAVGQTFGCDTGSNNLTSGMASSIFVNASGANLHLILGSSAIDTGTTLGSPWNIDYDGTNRPQGSAYDIGAYEYVSGTASLNGDINGDKIVNSLDWSLMSAKWLTNDTNADLNKDGAVNSLDWSIMSSNWLKTI